jgi:mRNA-degrading endonuclease toxin of MazEF toxin-antitoxin module
MNPGQIWLAFFPFGNQPARKLRPILLSTPPMGSAYEVVAAYISRGIPADLMASDLILDPSQPEYASTNLKAVSVLRLHKLATIHQSSVIRYLGQLSSEAMDEVKTRWRALFNL